MNSRQRLVAAARVAFLAAGAWFIWRSLDGRGDDLRAGLGATPVWGLILSELLVCSGLVLTALLWRRILAGFGYQLDVVPAAAVFFFGQLGKYIPGSVWSFGAQAAGARRHRVPVVTTVNASLVFLGIHVATGSVLGFTGATLIGSDTRVPWGLAVLAAVGGLVVLAPPVIRGVTRLVGRSAGGLTLTLATEVPLLLLMTGAWACYAASLFLLRPSVDASTIALIVVGYAIGYVAGVLVFLAPAGVGAREATFVFVTGHVLGVGGAAALALLTRVVMTIADVLLAWAAVALDRRRSVKP